jgi:hypothetical protein
MASKLYRNAELALTNHVHVVLLDADGNDLDRVKFDRMENGAAVFSPLVGGYIAHAFQLEFNGERTPVTPLNAVDLIESLAKEWR